MMKVYSTVLLLFIGCFITLAGALEEDDWGFYAHRKINFLATFLLPMDMLPFYKEHIVFLEEHAVDADKRRYAIQAEAPKHYIDSEKYGLDSIPSSLGVAAQRYLMIHPADGQRPFELNWVGDSALLLTLGNVSISLSKRQLNILYFYNILPHRDQEVVELDLAEVLTGIDTTMSVLITDELSEKGIAPFYLPFLADRLTAAFRRGDIRRILHYSADIGHYVSDLHVPLHTTENYNGQLTEQLGIHAFWESRLPELFAEDEYDFYIPQAEYIENLETYFMDIMHTSFSLVPKVLNGEKNARKSLASDEIWCYDDRNGVTARLQCEEYARRFAESMDDMVEQRMRAAIRSVASVWYTCWVNAGSPELSMQYVHSARDDDSLDKNYGELPVEGIRLHNY